jgi:hypothetical protein
MSFKVVQVIDTAIHRSVKSKVSILRISRAFKAPTELGKLRRQFSLTILTLEVMAGGALLGIILTFLFSFLRHRTWLLFGTFTYFFARISSTEPSTTFPVSLSKPYSMSLVSYRYI